MTDVEISRRLAQIDERQADWDSERQRICYAPWALMLAGITSGAVLFAAGAASVKLFP